MKEKNGDWSSHIPRVKNIGIIHYQMLKIFLNDLHCSSLVFCDGYLHHMMFVEIPSHHFHHVPELDWDVHSG